MNKSVLAIVIIFVLACAAYTQTSSFTYQGKLTDSAISANGPYDFTFRLYDQLTNGTQIGTDIVRDDVVVSNGIFSVDLDFGAAAFAKQTEISDQSSVISGQQKQIEDLNSKIRLQQAQIDALKKFICAQNPTAETCKEKK